MWVRRVGVGCGKEAWVWSVSMRGEGEVWVKGCVWTMGKKGGCGL